MMKFNQCLHKYMRTIRNFLWKLAVGSVNTAEYTDTVYVVGYVDIIHTCLKHALVVFISAHDK